MNKLVLALAILLDAVGPFQSVRDILVSPSAVIVYIAAAAVIAVTAAVIIVLIKKKKKK